MLKKKVVFDNEQGLHARPASVLVKVANQFSSELKLIKDSKEANLKSILGLLWLKVRHRDEVFIVAKGIDEEQAVAKLVDLIENRLKIVSYQKNGNGNKIEKAQNEINSLEPSEVLTMLHEGVKANLKDLN